MCSWHCSHATRYSTRGSGSGFCYGRRARHKCRSAGADNGRDERPRFMNLDELLQVNGHGKVKLLREELQNIS